VKASPRLVLIGLIPGGRATTPPQLQPSPDIGEKITSYNDRSVNEDENCSSTQLQTAGSMQALKDTPRKLVVSAQYFFQSFNHDRRRGVGCEGSDTRTFTLDKAGGALTVAGMSGPQGASRAGTCG
jgi:hypothetical protein